MANAIVSHLAVMEAAATGLRDPLKGENIKVFLGLRSGE